MNDFLATAVHFLPLVTVRRERVLPLPGKILVRKGQKVGANDAVVEAKLNPKHTLLDIAMGLAISRSKSETYIRVKKGDHLSKGDLIAGPVGIGRRVMRAQQNCQVVIVGSDQILLELTENPYQVKAGMSGEVVELIADVGVVIETVGALIQGNWGNGRIDFGTMKILAKDHRLLPEQFDPSMRGEVIVGGHCDSENTLRLAQELPVCGLILASMLMSLRSVAEEMDYPILLLEGFGEMEINRQAYQLLVNNERREVSVNAQQWNAFEGRRPEIVIPLPGETGVSPPRKVVKLAANQMVRSVRAPYPGKIGRLTRLCGTVTLPNGIRAQAAEVQYDNGEKSILPVENIEIII